MKCQFCGQELPEGAKFCFNCNKQITCLACGKPLVDGAQICVFCGREVKSRTKNPEGNHIKFSESGSEKSFEASFSDETAGNVVSVFASLVPGLKLKSIPSPDSDSGMNSPTIVIQDAVPSDNNDINKIFREKDGVVSLVEKRLKAKSKTDQQARASMLLLLYCQQNMKEKMTRDSLYNFLRAENLYDSNYRAWLSHHSHFFLRDENVIELSPEGEEVANTYLNEVFDDSIDSVWKSSGPGQPSKARAAANDSLSSQPKIVSGLNLNPSGKESLSAFMNRHKYRKSSSQHNLLFVYYLKQVLKLPNINQDHVYTCYRALGAKLPNDLYHSLSDNISKNRWLMNISDLNLTAKGLNFVEHDMTEK